MIFHVCDWLEVRSACREILSGMGKLTFKAIEEYTIQFI